MQSPLPNQVHSLSTEKQLKAYLHPLRMKILGFLARAARTISQVASELQVHPANLTHHFKILEKTGLIQMVEARDIGRVVEKYYRAVAENFDIRPLGGVSGANAKVLSFLRNDLNSALSSLKGDDSETLIGLVKQAKISKGQCKEFAEKLVALVDEFERANVETGTAHTLNLSLYPFQKDYGPLQRIEIRKKQKKGKI